MTMKQKKRKYMEPEVQVYKVEGSAMILAGSAGVETDITLEEEDWT